VIQIIFDIIMIVLGCAGLAVHFITNRITEIRGVKRGYLLALEHVQLTNAGHKSIDPDIYESYGGKWDGRKFSGTVNLIVNVRRAMCRKWDEMKWREELSEYVVFKENDAEAER